MPVLSTSIVIAGLAVITGAWALVRHERGAAPRSRQRPEPLAATSDPSWVL